MSCPWDIASAKQGSRLRALRPHHGRYVGPHQARGPHPQPRRLPTDASAGRGTVRNSSVRSAALTAEEVPKGTGPQSWNRERDSRPARSPAAGDGPACRARNGGTRRCRRHACPAPEVRAASPRLGQEERSTPRVAKLNAAFQRWSSQKADGRARGADAASARRSRSAPRPLQGRTSE
jgi:hypothetical protein